MAQRQDPGWAIELESIEKRFGGVRALDGVDLRVRTGSIHALLGENGAGKSTLIKILSGLLRPDAGTLRIAGRELALHGPRDGRRYGISVVPQELVLVPELSIGRNIMLGSERAATSRSALSERERRAARTALDQVGAAFDVDAPTRSLSVPEIRLAQVARALVHPGQVLVLDEPTAVLSENDADHILERLAMLRETGTTIIYVTHRLDEVMRLADRMTILRDGRNVETLERADADRETVVRLMTKGWSADAAAVGARSVDPDAPVVLEVSGLSSGRSYANVDLVARAGQIVGIAGVQGSGHGPLLRTIAGLASCDAGTIAVDDKPLRPGSITAAQRQGVMLVPADRRTSGTVLGMSIAANLALPRRVRRACRRLGLRWVARERAMAGEYHRGYRIKAAGVGTPVGQLSGGNQQKVSLARVVECDPRVLLVEEPTQGIDIRAKSEIKRLLKEQTRGKGSCVIVGTSEFDDLLGLADVIHVMRLGEVVATLGPECCYGDVLAAALP